MNDWQKTRTRHCFIANRSCRVTMVTLSMPEVTYNLTIYEALPPGYLFPAQGCDSFEYFHFNLAYFSCNLNGHNVSLEQI